MAKKEGKKGTINLNDGTYASPTWNKITGVRDLKITGPEWDRMEVGDRDVDMKLYLLSQYDFGVEFDLIWDPANTDHTALRTQCLAGTADEFAVLDGPTGTAGSIGFRGEFFVQGFPIDMPLSEGMKVSIKLCPYAGYANALATFTTS